MSRNITSGVITESKKKGSSVIRPIDLVRMEFDSGVIRVWNGRGPIVANGEVYDGTGKLGKISAIEETVEQKSTGVVFELSGVDPSLISIALNEDVQGRTCEVFKAFLNDSYQVVTSPILMFRGRMDIMTVTATGKEAIVRVTAESRLIDWNVPRIRRYTDASQKERFPNDKFFEFVSEIVEKEFNWGGVTVGGQGGGTVAIGSGGGGFSTREGEGSGH